MMKHSVFQKVMVFLLVICMVSPQLALALTPDTLAANGTYALEFDNGAVPEFTDILGSVSNTAPTVSEGCLRFTNLHGNRFLIRDSPSEADGIFSARFRSNNADRVGFALRTNNNADQRMFVVINGMDAPKGWQVYGPTPGTSPYYMIETGSGGKANVWYNITIYYQGEQVDLVVQDESTGKEMRASYQFSGMYTGAGQLGIVSWGDPKSLEIDYMRWRPYEAPPQPSSVTISGISSAIKVDETVQASAAVLPEGADQTVTWSINEEGAQYASVTQDGLVTGLAEGTFTLTAATSNGKTASQTITVSGKVQYPIAVIGGTSKVNAACQGDTVSVSAAGTQQLIFSHWSCSDADVEFVDPYAESTAFTMPAHGVTVVANYCSKGNTIYYIDAKNGNDSNSGTDEYNAWKSLDRINILALAPGDQVLLKAGSVFINQGLELQGNGSQKSPIVVGMYGEGDLPRIQANGVPETKCIISSSGNNALTEHIVSYGIHLKNISYVKLEKLDITNDPLQNELATGVFVEACGEIVVTGIHLDGLYVHDVNGDPVAKAQPNGGIFFKTTVLSTDSSAKEANTKLATRFDSITVENCTVKNVARTGISVGSSHAGYWWSKEGGRIPEEYKQAHGHTNVLIQNNYVENSGGDAIVPQFCISPIIQYNISNGASQMSHTDQSQYNAGIWPWRCEDALFQYNEAYNTVKNGDGQGYDCDFSRGTVYQYNYSHNNGGGFMLVCQAEALDSVVRYNISQSDGDSLFLMSNSDPADIYNNTFYIDDNLRCIVEGNGPAVLTNNIFYNVGSTVNSAPQWGNNFTYDHNLYYGFDMIPSSEKNGIQADPMFCAPGTGGTGGQGASAIDTVGGYALKAGSPAIHAGTAIDDTITQDYAGNPIAAIPSLGALEYISKTFAVTFSSNGGSAVSTQTVSEGGRAVKPADPTRKGYRFDGWYVDAELSKVYDFTAAVTADITLYANWIAESLDKGDLAAAIAAAVAANDGVVTSDETADKVAKGTKFVTESEMKALADAIDAAQVIVNNADATQSEVEAAVSALNAAVEAFNSAIKIGTKEQLGSPANPVLPVLVTSPTTTEVTENADGSVTTTVTDNKTGTVTETTEKKDGTVKVVEMQKDGTVTEIVIAPDGSKTEKITDSGENVAITVTDAEGEVLILAKIPAEVSASATRFVDVPEGHWAAEAIQSVTAMGLMDGVGSDRFSMGTPMTRGMLSTVLFRFSNGKKGMDINFNDVAEGKYYADGVAWAAKIGVVNGISESKFAPDMNITREQLATMLYRYAAVLGLDTTVDSLRLGSFVDSGSIHGYAVDSMAWCVANGILNGVGNDTLAPTDLATRAQVAVMLQRLIDLMK